MSRIHEWRISNSTTGRVSFDDKVLDAAGSLMVHRLTDDILAGFGQGRLLISPDPTKAIPGLAALVAINPCQLPLPVRIVGTTQNMVVGNKLVDAPMVSVPHTSRLMFLDVDRRRVMWRARNVGTVPLWFGGADVTDANGFVSLLPGEIYTERDVPAAAWHVYVAANLNNISGTLIVQQVYTGVV